MNWLHSNVQWVFSGIGVLVVSLTITAVLWVIRGRKNEGAPPLVATLSPVGVQPAAVAISQTREISLKRVFETRRLSSGDYAVFKIPDATVFDEIRVTLRGLIRDSTDASESEFLADLQVDLGGALIFGGAKCRKVAVNRFQVPALRFDDEEETLFAFSNTPDHVRFVNVRVDHINPHAGAADISVIAYRKVWLS